MLRRLQEIEARKKELLTELEGDVTEERMAQIEAEQSALAQEEKTLRKKLDIRERLGNRTESPKAGDADLSLIPTCPCGGVCEVRNRWAP